MDDENKKTGLHNFSEKGLIILGCMLDHTGKYNKVRKHRSKGSQGVVE